MPRVPRRRRVAARAGAGRRGDSRGVLFRTSWTPFTSSSTTRPRRSCAARDRSRSTRRRPPAPAPRQPWPPPWTTGTRTRARPPWRTSRPRGRRATAARRMAATPTTPSRRSSPPPRCGTPCRRRARRMRRVFGGLGGGVPRGLARRGVPRARSVRRVRGGPAADQRDVRAEAARGRRRGEARDGRVGGDRAARGGRFSATELYAAGPRAGERATRLAASASASASLDNATSTSPGNVPASPFVKFVCIPGLPRHSTNCESGVPTKAETRLVTNTESLQRLSDFCGLESISTRSWVARVVGTAPAGLPLDPWSNHPDAVPVNQTGIFSSPARGVDAERAMQQAGGGAGDSARHPVARDRESRGVRLFVLRRRPAHAERVRQRRRLHQTHRQR